MSVLQQPAVSRRERALVSPAEAARRAFGRYCAELERLQCVYPTQLLGIGRAHV